MIRKMIAALAVSAAALVLTATPALAEVTTPAIQVEAESSVVPQAVRPPVRTPIEVSGVSSELPAPATTSSQVIVAGTSNHTGSLSYTGISFNVPLTLTIGGLVVLAGFALMYFGGRNLRRGHRAH